MTSLLYGSSNFSFVVWFTEALVTFVPSRNLILKTLVTLCAIEWNLSRVDPLMGFQVTWCWEALVTVCALEWLLSHVSYLMFLQVASYWKALVTLWAVKRLYLCGSFHATWSWKIFVTLCALKWLHSCVVLCVSKLLDEEKLLSLIVHLNGIVEYSWVDPLMGFQVTWCWEAIVTFVHLNGFSPVWVPSCSFK